MAYSLDLRKRVINYVQNGGRYTDASRLFGVNRKTIYNWLARTDLAPSRRKPYKSKLDKQALSEHVKAFPDMILRERAAYFNVQMSTIWYALKKLNITKKNGPI